MIDINRKSTKNTREFLDINVCKFILFFGFFFYYDI